ncbi:hypothetical protein WMF20_28450 [Sorangium sp. So ce834]|uniref:hypothetical protein n=1 Tax=Sorangium sp. So ce834 TaxID=3133321 RepID=UPI003F5E9765
MKYKISLDDGTATADAERAFENLEAALDAKMRRDSDFINDKKWDEWIVSINMNEDRLFRLVEQALGSVGFSLESAEYDSSDSES